MVNKDSLGYLIGKETGLTDTQVEEALRLMQDSRDLVANRSEVWTAMQASPEYTHALMLLGAYSGLSPTMELQVFITAVQALTLAFVQDK